MRKEWPSIKRMTVAFLILSVFLGACQKPKGGVTVVGSTSVQPFVEALAEEYMVHHRQEKIYVQGGGSSAGIQAVLTGAAHVGMSSRNLKPDEKNLKAVAIAYDAIAVIVNPRNGLASLTLEQIREIFSGRIKRWDRVGGQSGPITLVSREEGSGTREAFQHLVMGKTEISLAALVQDSNGAIRQVVADDPNAIGYISLGLVDEQVKALNIDGVEPSIENIKTRRYRIVRPFLFVFDSSPVGLVKDFLDYVLSPKGQELLTHEGLISRSALPDEDKGARE